MMQQPDAMRGELPNQGELRCGGMRLPLQGRTLRLILWMAAHQRDGSRVRPDLAHMEGQRAERHRRRHSHAALKLGGREQD